jgi:fused signal recognition particle receptor
MRERLETAESSPQATSSSFWKKLKRGLFMTHSEIYERLGAAVEGRAILDEKTLEDLEESLITADLGVETTLELVDRVRQQVRRGEGRDTVRLRDMLVDEMAILLMDAVHGAGGERADQPGDRPLVSLIVGVNGVGKTTSIAKLAWRAREHGEQVLLAAADTFRAAAVEQLVSWGERLGVEVIRQRSGADPAAVVYDAIQAGRARRVDQIIVDTAGRLHTKSHLMEELAKIGRVIDREARDATRRTILVLDATTGQNALHQAREFTQAASVDGLLLAKLDGTAKGGMVVAVARALRVPVLYLGVGESEEDLVEFRPREFAAALIG